MKLALRTLALVIGVIGFIIGVIVNFAFSAIRFIRDMAGAGVPPSHGVLGFLVLVVGLIGSLLAPFSAVPAAVLLLLAGIAMFFIIHWAALLVSPFFIVAAILAYLDRPTVRAARAARAG